MSRYTLSILCCKVLEKEIKEKRMRMIELSSAPGDDVDGEKLAEERRIIEERY